MWASSFEQPHRHHAIKLSELRPDKFERAGRRSLAPVIAAYHALVRSAAIRPVGWYRASRSRLRHRDQLGHAVAGRVAAQVDHVQRDPGLLQLAEERIEGGAEHAIELRRDDHVARPPPSFRSYLGGNLSDTGGRPCVGRASAHTGQAGCYEDAHRRRSRRGGRVDDRPDPFAELLPNCYPAEFLPVDNFG